MDISQILERAKAISNDEGDEIKTGENDNDFGAIVQAVRLVKILNEINKVNKNNENDMSVSDKKQEPDIKEEINEGGQVSKIELEKDMQTPAIRTIKAAIPYLDYEYQRNIGIMVKIIELDNLIKNYKTTAGAMSLTKKKGWQKEMLLSMKPELDRRNQYYIDMLVRFIDIKDIMENMQREDMDESKT